MVFLNDVNFVDLLMDKLNIEPDKNIRKYGSLGTVCPQYILEETATVIAERFLEYHKIKPVIFAMSSYGFIYVKDNGYDYVSFIDVSCDRSIYDLEDEKRELLEKLRKLYIVSTGEEIKNKKRVIKVLHSVQIDCRDRNINKSLQEWLKNNESKEVVSINVIDGKVNIIFE